MTDYLQLHREYQNKGVFSQLILDSAIDAIFTKSPDGIITSWSKGAEKIYGYTRQEIVGKPVSIIIPEDKSVQHADILEKVNKGKKIERLETQRLSKDGRLIDLIISVVPIFDEGIVIGAAVFQRDISLQKEAEKKWQDLFEQASDAIFIADINGRYTDVNAYACDMLGYSKKELLGKTIFDMIPPEDARRLRESKELLLKPGEIQIAEWLLKKKDDTYLPVEVSAKILPDGRWQGFVRDISKQKEAEKKFSFIFDSAPDAHIIINPEGIIQMANEQSEKTFGYPKSELIGQKIEMLLPEKFRKKHPEYRKKFISEFRRRRMGSGLQLRALKKDGSEIPVDIMLSPIRLDKEIIVLASVRDLSELKELSAYARSLIEASPDPFIVTNLDGIITDANKETLEVLCCLENEKLKGMSLSSYFADPESLKENISKVLEKGRVKNVPFSVRDSKGHLLDFLVSASVYEDYKGKAEGIFYVLKDISELIRIASKLIAEETRAQIK